MSRFVQRDASGAVIAHFANCQPGYATEEVADDHPDIMTFVAARAANRATAAERKRLLDPEALLARIVELEKKLSELGR